jgi:hypothetical protein
MNLPIQKESSDTYYVQVQGYPPCELGRITIAPHPGARETRLWYDSQSSLISTYPNNRRPMMLKELLTLVILYLRSTLKSNKALAALRKLAPVLIEARDLLDEVIQTIPVETQAKARKLYLKGTDEHLF